MTMKPTTTTAAAATAAAAAVAAATATVVAVVALQRRSRRHRARREAAAAGRNVAAHEVVVLGDGETGLEIARELRRRAGMLDESQQQRASFNVVLVTGSPRAPWLWRLLWDDLAAPDAVLVGQVASVCSEGLVLSSGRVIDYDALICTSDDAGAPAVTDSLATSVCSYLDALQLDAFATESATPLAFPAEWSRRGQHGLEVEPGSFRVKATPHVFAMGACADTPARGLWPTDPVVQTQAIASGVLASLLAE